MIDKKDIPTKKMQILEIKFLVLKKVVIQEMILFMMTMVT